MVATGLGRDAVGPLPQETVTNIAMRIAIVPRMSVAALTPPWGLRYEAASSFLMPFGPGHFGRRANATDR